jgi:hypothetical protein
MDLGGTLLGAVASAAYWLPVWLSREALVLEQMTLPLGALVQRLLLPTDVILLYLGTPAVRSDLIYTDAIPMILAIGAGLSLILLARTGVAVRLAALGFSLALAFALLLAIFPRSESGILALLNWRHLYTIRIGLCLAAIPLLLRISVSRQWTEIRAPRWIYAALAVVAIGLGLWWGTPLRSTVADPRSEEVQQVQSLWDWLRSAGDAELGRVYLQDTYACPPRSSLTHSHILARTSEMTGFPQLGPWYGVVPYGTARWTRGEFGALFDYGDQVTDSEEGYEDLLHRMFLANVGLVVISNPSLATRLLGREPFQLRQRIGRFSVFAVEDAPRRWAEALTPGTHVDVVSYQPGSIALNVNTSQEAARIGIRESWHPFWRIDGDSQVRITQSGPGLIRLENIPPGSHQIDLRWKSPRLSIVLSLLGWGCILVVGGLSLRRRAVG